MKQLVTYSRLRKEKSVSSSTQAVRQLVLINCSKIQKYISGPTLHTKILQVHL